MTEDPKGICNIDELFSQNAYGVVELVDGTKVKCQFTMRYGISTEKALAQLDEWTAFLEGATTRGIRFEGPAALPPVAPAPTPSKAVVQAMQDGDNETAAVMQAAIEELPAPPDGKQWKSFDAVVVEILPQPDDRVNINFFGNQHKQPHDEFPGVKVTKWKLDSAGGLLKHVATVDVSKPQKLTLPCRVFYTDGKEYTKTDGGKGNYKDVGAVRQIP